MQKGIKAYKIERFIRKKATNSVSFFPSCSFSSFSLSLSFSFFFWGGIISINLGLKGSPPPPQKKNSCEEEGHHILQELPVKSHQPPFPIKNERFPVPKSLQVPLFKETLPFLVPLNNILFHCWSTAYYDKHWPHSRKHLKMQMAQTHSYFGRYPPVPTHYPFLATLEPSYS